MPRRIKQESDVGTVDTSVGGDGTLAIEFDDPFHVYPTVVVGFATSLGAGKRGFCAATSVTVGGFTITIDSDTAASTIDVAWIASERNSSGKAALK